MAIFNLTRWPSIAIFLLAGCVAVGLAFLTVNLFSQAMASLDFIRSFGLEAIRHGALWQVAQLFAWGVLALSCWVIFKICEQILEDRYLTWARKTRRRAARAQPVADTVSDKAKS